MKINRFITNVCSNNLESSKCFYTSLFGFKVEYDSDWFIHLVSKVGKLELGIISETHDIVPTQAKGHISGAYLTFVVEDVNSVMQKAEELGYQILQPPQLTFYGQNRMLLNAPEGTVCDVSSPVSV